MAEGWTHRIKDPDEIKVFKGLADPKWDFRTDAAIAKETGLSLEKVRMIISKYPELIRVSSLRDKQGRELYTLKGRTKLKEALDLARVFISKSTA